MITHLLVFLLALLGFQLLARKQRQAPRSRKLVLFWLGWLSLLIALAGAIWTWGFELGLTLWLGHMSAGAGSIFLFRIWRQRYAL